MFTRAALAAIDYNCNLDRSLARNKDGSLQFDQVCNRNGNKWFVKTRKEKKDVSFRDVIAKQILEVQINGKIMNSIVGEFFQCVEERKKSLDTAKLALGRLMEQGKLCLRPSVESRMLKLRKLKLRAEKKKKENLIVDND